MFLMIYRTGSSIPDGLSGVFSCRGSSTAPMKWTSGLAPEWALWAIKGVKAQLRGCFIHVVVVILDFKLLIESKPIDQDLIRKDQTWFQIFLSHHQQVETASKWLMAGAHPPDLSFFSLFCLFFCYVIRSLLLSLKTLTQHLPCFLFVASSSVFRL